MAHEASTLKGMSMQVGENLGRIPEGRSPTSGLRQGFPVALLVP